MNESFHKKYEYRTVNLSWTDDRDKILNEMGNQGWLLIQIEPRKLIRADDGGIIAILTFYKEV